MQLPYLERPPRIPTRALAALALAALLAACSSVGPNPLPQDANLVLTVHPAEAKVSVTGDAEVTLVSEQVLEPQGSGREVRYRAAPGHYTVRIEAEGHRTVETSVDVDGAAPAVVEVELEPQDGPTEPSGDPSEEDPSGEPAAGDPEPGDPEPVRAQLSLRGDPGFEISQLSPEAREWYERYWYALRNPRDGDAPSRWASSDNTYAYGRVLHEHVQGLLFAFRATGDLALLDEVDRLAELMRAELRDEWRDTTDGTDGTKDGYLNWVYRYKLTDTKQIGKDTIKTNEIKTHALVAEFAYALEANRDLESPSGRNYAAHADFWKYYLVEHFEAKWREREGVPSGFPFLTRRHTHTFISALKWHYYMGKLLDDDAYLQEAETMADRFWNREVQLVSTPDGDAYVWARSILSMDGTGDYLHPTTYVRYVFNDSIDFHFEGFHAWADERVLERMARTFVQFISDRDGAEDGDDWFAPDMGGGTARAGLDASGWSRFDNDAFRRSHLAGLMAWDDTGAYEDIVLAVLEDVESDVTRPNVAFMPGAVFLDRALEALRAGTLASSER